jgi:hypothetical protein
VLKPETVADDDSFDIEVRELPEDCELESTTTKEKRAANLRSLLLGLYPPPGTSPN